jgi:hypothetical protein
MNKKTQIKTLQLSRETIRQLDHGKLAGIAGGRPEEITQVITCMTPVMAGLKAD